MLYPKKKSNSFITAMIAVVLSCLFFWLDPVQASGASLYLSPAVGTYVIGGSFSVSVKVNAGGTGINAAEGSIAYDTDLLEATQVSGGGSIFPFWTTQPAISGGSIRFGGGLPPPAYSGSAGHIVKITFKTKKAGQASVRFTSGAVLANDGKGTNILASMGSANYTIAPKVEAPKTDSGTKKSAADSSAGQKKDETEREEEQGVEKPQIKSETHPDQNIWHNKNDVKFSWNLPVGVDGVSIDFNQSQSSDPGPSADGLFKEKEYVDTADGVWFLHLKFKSGKKWSVPAHYKVMIDTEAPQAFTVAVEEAGAGEWPLLRFETKDDKSGLDKYLLHLGDLAKEPAVLSADKKEFQAGDLAVGTHSVIIKAIDKAGNERVSSASFIVPPLPAPQISAYPREMKPADDFYLSGTAASSSAISIYIENAKGEVMVKGVESDQNGNWFFLDSEKYEAGRYFAWVEAKNKNGIGSLPSEKVMFLVSLPVFAVIGSFVINYFTVFASLLFMIFLIMALVVYIMGFVRRRLKRETVEIEKVLHENLTAYKKDLEKEFLRLHKFEGKEGYEGEKEKSEDVLKRKIDGAEKRILKEIRDVEKIVK